MYQYAKSLVKRFAGEKDGAAFAEYALLVGLVALGAIVALGALSDDFATALTNIGNQLTNANPGPGGT